MYECSFTEKKKKEGGICKQPQQWKNRETQAPYWRQSNKHVLAAKQVFTEL